jgi:hypothetical protein
MNTASFIKKAVVIATSAVSGAASGARAGSLSAPMIAMLDTRREQIEFRVGVLVKRAEKIRNEEAVHESLKAASPVVIEIKAAVEATIQEVEAAVAKKKGKKAADQESVIVAEQSELAEKCEEIVGLIEDVVTAAEQEQTTVRGDSPEVLEILEKIKELQALSVKAYAMNVLNSAYEGMNFTIGSGAMGAVVGAIAGVFADDAKLDLKSTALSLPGSLAGGAAGSAATTVAVEASMAAADAATKEGTWARWIARKAAKLGSFATGVMVSNATSSAIDNAIGGSTDWVGLDADGDSEPVADEQAPAEEQTPAAEQTEEYVH